MSEQLLRDFAALEGRVNKACDLLLQAAADTTLLMSQRSALLLALTQLRDATQSVLGTCDPELRQAAGHPAVNAVYKALQDADLAIAAVEVGA